MMKFAGVVRRRCATGSASRCRSRCRRCERFAPKLHRALQGRKVILRLLTPRWSKLTAVLIAIFLLADPTGLFAARRRRRRPAAAPAPIDVATGNTLQERLASLV